MKRNHFTLLPKILAVVLLAGTVRMAAAADAGNDAIPRGKGSHADLVALLDEFLVLAKGQNEVEEVQIGRAHV